MSRNNHDNRWPQFLGRGYANKGDRIACTIGERSFTVREMAKMEVWSPRGCKKLERRCRRLGIRTFDEYLALDGTEIPAWGYGDETIHAAMAIVESVGRSPMRWVSRGGRPATITTIKKRKARGKPPLIGRPFSDSE